MKKSLFYIPNFAGEFDSVSLFEEQGLVALHIPKNSQFRGHSTLIKRENKIFLIYKEIQNGAVAKSYIRKGFLICEERANIMSYMRRPLVIYDFATAPFRISLYRGKFDFLFYQ